jgi:type IV pilus assembly protein PilN
MATAVAGAAGPANLNNIIVGALVALAVVIAAGYWFINYQTRNKRQEEVAARKAEADKLEAIIKEVEDFQKRKDSLQNRIDLINQLKQNQKGPVHIMDQISRDLPDLVWLDRMSITGGRISISGRGLNPNAIANFVENVKNDPYFEEPQLGNVTQVSTTPLVYGYDMDFAFSYVPKVPGAAPAGTPGATGTAPATGTAGKPGGAPAR